MHYNSVRLAQARIASVLFVCLFFSFTQTLFPAAAAAGGGAISSRNYHTDAINFILSGQTFDTHLAQKNKASSDQRENLVNADNFFAYHRSFFEAFSQLANTDEIAYGTSEEKIRKLISMRFTQLVAREVNSATGALISTIKWSNDAAGNRKLDHEGFPVSGLFTPNIKTTGRLEGLKKDRKILIKFERNSAPRAPGGGKVPPYMLTEDSIFVIEERDPATGAARDPVSYRAIMARADRFGAAGAGSAGYRHGPGAGAAYPHASASEPSSDEATRRVHTFNGALGWNDASLVKFRDTHMHSSDKHMRRAGSSATGGITLGSIYRSFHVIKDTALKAPQAGGAPRPYGIPYMPEIATPTKYWLGKQAERQADHSRYVKSFAVPVYELDARDLPTDVPIRFLMIEENGDNRVKTFLTPKQVIENNSAAHPNILDRIKMLAKTRFEDLKGMAVPAGTDRVALLIQAEKDAIARGEARSEAYEAKMKAEAEELAAEHEKAEQEKAQAIKAEKERNRRLNKERQKEAAENKKTAARVREKAKEARAKKAAEQSRRAKEADRLKKEKAAKEAEEKAEEKARQDAQEKETHVIQKKQKKKDKKQKKAAKKAALKKEEADIDAMLAAAIAETTPLSPGKPLSRDAGTGNFREAEKRAREAGGGGDQGGGASEKKEGDDAISESPSGLLSPPVRARAGRTGGAAGFSLGSPATRTPDTPGAGLFPSPQTALGMLSDMSAFEVEEAAENVVAGKGVEETPEKRRQDRVNRRKARQKKDAGAGAAADVDIADAALAIPGSPVRRSISGEPVISSPGESEFAA